MEFVSSKKLEVVAKFLVDDEVDGVAPCSYLNNYLKEIEWMYLVMLEIVKTIAHFIQHPTL